MDFLTPVKNSHMDSSILTEHNFPIIDWSNESEAAETAAHLLEALAADKALLTRLTQNALTDPNLFSMCECHTYDDKIVLFSGLKTHGYRIRFRLAKQVERERIHNHRFTAIHHLISGQFTQQYFTPKKAVADLQSMTDFDLKHTIEHGAGQSFEVHYQDFHTSKTAIGTISLLLRGPVKNAQAIGFNCADDSVRIRKGFADSSASENTEHLMPKDTFGQWVETLRQQNIIHSFEI